MWATLVVIEWDVVQVAKYTESQWKELQQTLAMQYEGQILARERSFASQLEEKAAQLARLQKQLDALKAEKQNMSGNLASMQSVTSLTLVFLSAV